MEVQTGTKSPLFCSFTDMDHVVQSANATIEKIMAKNEVHAALPPPPALLLLTEKPEQHAKKEKIVARMMHAWIAITSEGMAKLLLLSQSPLDCAQARRRESGLHVFCVLS